MGARRPGPATARRRAQAGVTLIEVVAVIAVMMIAVPPLTGLYTQVASASVDETYQAEALSLAETLMEEIVSKAYEDPVVIMGPLTSAGGHPSTVRVKNVSPTGFEWQIDEWDYLDGAHIVETVG